MMRFIQRIRHSVDSKVTCEPFRAKDFPFLKRSPSYLSKHAVGNGRYSEYFVRVGRGLYRLK